MRSLNRSRVGPLVECYVPRVKVLHPYPGNASRDASVQKQYAEVLRVRDLCRGAE